MDATARRDVDMTAPATMQSEAMRRSGADDRDPTA
ncbi:hypothetical protein TMFG_03367 [Mycobacterium tuberculosis SUMu006]|nr:hypothetical protein TMCG_03508 [Mycobacterium tuberculosis SUMu003]EFP31961.1 hypothetical protein TMFG_03367 [Mycobacterium tuberculosis SUMu006]